MSASAPAIAITGGRGLVGAALAARLRATGRGVVVLTRGAPRAPWERAWNPLDPDPSLFAGLHAIVHLSGATIGARWTAARRREIRTSRVDVTRALVRALALVPDRPRVLISASAIGIYGDRGDEQLDEESAPGSNWLASLAVDWEAAAAEAESLAMRVVIPRFGLVLSTAGGVLVRMLPAFRLGLGGPVGNGRQWWSWIALEDLLALLAAALDDPAFAGRMNAVAPEPARSRDFALALGRVLHRPAFLPAPAPALRLVFGEMADETLLASHRVTPRRLLERGFPFRHRELAAALGAMLASVAPAGAT